MAADLADLQRQITELRGLIAKHGGRHELSGGDEVRLSVLNSTTHLNRQRSIAAGTGLTATEVQGTDPYINLIVATGGVTLAMLANLANQTLIGRDTSGTGVPEAVTLTQLLGWAGPAWTGWTPQLDQGVTTNIAKGVTYAKYARVGRTIFFNLRLDITGVGTAGSAITFTLPVTAAALGASRIGTFSYYHVGVAPPEYDGFVYAATTTVAHLLDTTQANDVGIVPNIATANGDVLQLSGCYEAAA